MAQTVVSSQYLLIAQDIAGRIARGELPEGQKLYGRSVMASEYNVSPETIRRALRLLADMKVVDILQQSGVRVLSADSARRYIAKFGEDADIKALRKQLRDLMDEYETLHRRTTAIVSALIKSRDAFAPSGDPLPNYEVVIPPGSAITGKSIAEVKFWQATGATIVAIRRGPCLILSPGPYAKLFAGDVIVLVGTPAAAEAARRMMTEKE